MAVTFEYEDTKYTLEFNRNAVTLMEKGGFRLDQIGERPATLIPMLFEGAFLMHHRRVKEEKVHEIYKHVEDKEGLIVKLANMYQETVSSVLEEDDKDTKKISWEVQ